MKLLIVEDDTDQCKLYEEEIAGYNSGSNNEVIISYTIKNTKEEALEAVTKESFDSAIIDLNLGNGDEASGNDVIKKIFKEKRIPIYIVSGTPNEYDEIKELSGKSLLLKKLARDEKTIIEILDELVKFYNTGLTKILNRNGKLDQIMNEIFLNYSEKLVKDLIQSTTIKDSEKENIISRFCASIIGEKLKNIAPKYHPYEIYYTPPLKEEITTGDILVEKSSGKKRIILTPACDLEIRADRTRKVDTILVAGIESQNDIHTHNNPTNKNINTLIKELKSKKYKEYYEYLPLGHNSGQAINFSDLLCIELKVLDEFYTRESSLNETFLKEIIFNFSRYYGRQGIPDIH